MTFLNIYEMSFCYTWIMQPDDQKEYQPNNSADTDFRESREDLNMYQPEPENDSEQFEEPVTPSDDLKKVNTVEEPVHWTASEYIDEEKNGLWFVSFVLIVLALIMLDVFILKSYTFSVLVVVMAIAVIVYTRRPPRMIDYTLSGDQGLYVGERLYHFNEFKSFGLIRDREHHSIMLIPVKRFNFGLSVYFPEESGEKIVDILGARLPMENLKLDVVDIIVRKLRL